MKYSVFLFLLLLFSCSKTEKVPFDNAISDVENEAEIAKKDNNEESNWITKFTESGISYPLFIGVENADSINHIIKEEINELNNSYELTEESNIGFIIQYEDAKYISITFSGFMYNNMGEIYWPIMIDIENKSKLTLGDLITLNEHFVDLVYNDLQNFFVEMEIDIKDYYPKENIYNLLLEADKGPQSEVRSYFTKNQLCIIFHVPREMGNFYDVVLPIDVIDKIEIKKDNGA